MASRAPKGEELRTAPVGLRLKPSLKSELDELADADRRTLASYIEMVLEAHVEAKKQKGKRR
jgi:predicted DNA-binding protein